MIFYLKYNPYEYTESRQQSGIGWGNLLQFCSSIRLAQSVTPSQTQSIAMQDPSPHTYSSDEQSDLSDTSVNKSEKE